MTDVVADVVADASALRLAIFSDTYAPQVNGVARTLERLVHAVQERGGVARVFTVADPEALRDESLRAEGHTQNVVRYPSIPLWAYKGLRLACPIRRVRADVQVFAPTLIHSATEFGVGLAGRRVARSLGIPWLSSYHTNFSAYARHYHLGMVAGPGWRYLRWFHNGGLRTYCPSHSIAGELKARAFRNVEVWSRGVDATRFSPRFRATAIRERMGATPDSIVVCYIGRLAAEKNLDVALEAMHRVHALRPGRVRFAAVGDGPYAARVRALAPEGSWLPGVLHADDLSAAYASADLFIFPSTTDTFGNVLLEAMASGLPVIGADAGPTRELLASGGGWLVAPEDPQAFAEVVVAAVDNPSALKEARRAALATAAERTWPRVWDALVADYLRLHRPAGIPPGR